MTYINWSLVPVATHYCPSPVPGDDFYVASFALFENGRFVKCWQIEGDRVTKEIKQPIYTEDSRARMIPRPEWVDGLPPAGIECEFSLNRGSVGWSVGFVVGNSCSAQVVIKYGLNEFHARNRHGVRPICKPEQIAAEERDKAIKTATNDISSLLSGFKNDIDGGSAACAAIAAMIDAGYRKPVTP